MLKALVSSRLGGEKSEDVCYASSDHAVPGRGREVTFQEVLKQRSNLVARLF